MNQRKTQEIKSRFITLLSDRQTPKAYNIQDTLKCLLTPKQQKIDTRQNQTREIEKSFHTKKIEINRKNTPAKSLHTTNGRVSPRRPPTSMKNKEAVTSACEFTTTLDSDGKFILITSDQELQQPENKKTFVKFKNFYRVVKGPCCVSPTRRTQFDNLQRMVQTQMKQIVDVKSKEYTLVRPESHQMRSRQFSLDVRHRKTQKITFNVPKCTETGRYSQCYDQNNWPSSAADWVDFMFESVMDNAQEISDFNAQR